jgi:hypothetical protein
MQFPFFLYIFSCADIAKGLLEEFGVEALLDDDEPMNVEHLFKALKRITSKPRISREDMRQYEKCKRMLASGNITFTQGKSNELDQMFVVFVRIAEALEKGSGIN